MPQGKARKKSEMYNDLNYHTTEALSMLNIVTPHASEVIARRRLMAQQLLSHQAPMKQSQSGFPIKLGMAQCLDCFALLPQGSQ
ncbi:MAG: hypothetical protein ABIJ84_00415 [bacterium]